MNYCEKNKDIFLRFSYKVSVYFRNKWSERMLNHEKDAYAILVSSPLLDVLASFSVTSRKLQFEE